MVIYYTITSVIILFCWWKLSKFSCEDNNIVQCKIKSFVLNLPTIFGSFLIVGCTLGPIFYLAIPKLVLSHIVAEVVTITDDDYQKAENFIWSHPINNIKLEGKGKYIFNDSEDTVYIVSATYVPVQYSYPNIGNGICIKSEIPPHEMTKNQYLIYSYLEEIPDTITSHMRKFDSSTRTYYFLLSDSLVKELNY